MVRHILPPDSEAIAIIGMSARFPGARDIREFWDNLRNGVESITTFSEDELRDSGVGEAALHNPNFVRAGSVIEGVDLFDAQFFGFSPREAESLDPQQRLFLETAWRAIENAGYDPETFPGLIGVYGGCAMSTYLRRLESDPELMRTLGYLQVHIGNDKDYLTSRVSYALNLRGPSVSIQTGCSTSLLAVAVAADQLLSGQCDIALAGGVCVRVPQKVGYYYEEGGIFSPDGHCRVFDEHAGGVVFGNGVGVVVLKRLYDAVADGDTVDAIIKGWAVNNDGSSKASYAAPSVGGQAAVIRKALQRAGVHPRTISYVEAHGTGTFIGDPVEIAGLTRAFGGATQKTQFCAIGSVKTNVGHLDHAAGVAGLIKTVLALQYKEIPPSLHCEKPNPTIDFATTPFFVNDRLSGWTTTSGPRRAGVSAFGIGGTNVHLVLEEAPARPSRAEGESHHLLLLSAKTRHTLETMVSDLSQHLARNASLDPADIAYTTQVGRRAMDCRGALVYTSAADLLLALEAKDQCRLLESTVPTLERTVAFMFSGQGSQHTQMAAGLYEAEPVFRSTVDMCAEILRSHLGIDLRQLLYPDVDRAEQAVTRLTRTEFAQPALFTIEYALARLWEHLGIRPEVMIGHSIGEYVAACVAGVFSLEDALALVAARGGMMQQLPRGSMLAVPLAESQLESFLDAGVDVAATNEFSMSVVSGPTAAIMRLADRLTVAGVESQVLRTSHAFHSRMLEPVLDDFAARVAMVEMRAPSIPYVSNVTGDWVSAADATDPRYWARHMRLPVRWAEGLCRVLDDRGRILLEVGPGQALCTFARHHPDRTLDQHVIASLRRPQDPTADAAFFLGSVARLWLSGVHVDWTRLHHGRPRRRVHLPGYPFDRQRYWVDDRESVPSLPAVVEKEPDITDWLYVPAWEPAVAPERAGLNPASARWLVFDDGSHVGRAVIDHLQKRGDDVITVAPGAGFATDRAGRYVIHPAEPEQYAALVDALGGPDRVPRNILHLWSVGPSEEEEPPTMRLTHHQELGFYSLLYLVQALVKHHVSDPVQIVVASSDVQAVTGEESLCPARATLVGVCRTVPQEYPNIACRNVDIEYPLGDPSKTWVGQLVAELSDAELTPTVAYRSGRRWRQVFVPWRPEEPTSCILRRRGVYLLTGGVGRVGLALAAHLAGTVQAKLVLVGRSVFVPRQEWDAWLATHHPDDATSEKIRQLRYLEQQGAEVLIISADAADVGQMRSVVEQALGRFGQLDGVIHGAGNLEPSAFFGVDEANPASCERQFHAKVHGVMTLERVLRDQPLDFVLLVSSISSSLAGLGYVAYAAANIFLDVSAHQHRGPSSVPWVSVNWDTWEFGNEPGADPGRLSMSPREAMEVFGRILCSPLPAQVVVSTGHLPTRISQSINLTGWRGSRTTNDWRVPRLYARPSIATPYVAPRTGLEESVAAVWRETLGVAEVGVMDDFFTDLGGSSLLATQLIARLRDKFASDLPVRRLFESPTVAGVADAIASQSVQDTPSANEMTQEGMVQ